MAAVKRELLVQRRSIVASRAMACIWMATGTASPVRIIAGADARVPAREGLAAAIEIMTTRQGEVHSVARLFAPEALATRSRGVTGAAFGSRLRATRVTWSRRLRASIAPLRADRSAMQLEDETFIPQDRPAKILQWKPGRSG